jgi:hypothetical protein
MRKRLLCLSAIVLLAHVSLYAIGTIKEVRLADGYDDVNRISSPVFDASAARPVNISIRSAYDRGAKIVRRGATNMFTRGPEYNLDKAVDLGSLFTEALRTEAGSMGFRLASGSEAGWLVEGAIKDVYLESKQIPYGATLFYGYLDVEVQVRSGDGAAQNRRMRFHNYFGGYNAGLGRKDEAAEALAHLLVESAQEALSRLNRDFFRASALSAIDAKVSQLQSSGVGNRISDLHVVGLSGSSSASQALLALLPKEADENRRSALIDALARLGSPDAVPLLASRYTAEDEDCRWYTLKAMDYIGGPAALALVREHGIKDKDGGPRRLAQRIAGSS